MKGKGRERKGDIGKEWVSSIGEKFYEKRSREGRGGGGNDVKVKEKSG